MNGSSKYNYLQMFVLQSYATTFIVHVFDFVTSRDHICIIYFIYFFGLIVEIHFDCKIGSACMYWFFLNDPVYVTCQFRLNVYFEKEPSPLWI